MIDENDHTSLPCTLRTRALLRYLCATHVPRVSQIAMIDALVDAAIMNPTGWVRENDPSKLATRLLLQEEETQ